MGDVLVLLIVMIMVALLANGLYAAGFEKGKEHVRLKDVGLDIAYSNGFDPSTGEAEDFSLTDSDRSHIGIRNSREPHPSLDHSSYSWTRIRGNDGPPGPKGDNGANWQDPKGPGRYVEDLSTCVPTNIVQSEPSDIVYKDKDGNVTAVPDENTKYFGIQVEKTDSNEQSKSVWWVRAYAEPTENGYKVLPVDPSDPILKKAMIRMQVR